MPAFDIAMKCSYSCEDTFNADYAAALLKGSDIETTPHIPQAISVLDTMGYGSQVGVQNFEHTLNFMQTQKAGN
jgi:hypothetical protein